jgi:HEAT repeat protein
METKMKNAITRATALALIMTLGSAGAAASGGEGAEAAHPQAGDRAAAQLDAIGTPHARALAAAMRSGVWDRRRSETAGRFHAPSALPALRLALEDEQPVVRRLALWGMSELRDPGASDAALRFLADPAPEVRGEAARALGDMEATGDALAVAALLRDPHPFVRSQAAHALGDLQHPATRSALEAALADPDRRVRAEAGWALARVAETERLVARRGGRR